MSTEELSDLLKAGIQAAKSGRRIEARQLLEQVLERDDGNETAWMWFATVVDSPREKRICLENVLDINPGNQRAREALEKLGPATAEPPPPVTTTGGVPRPPAATTTPTYTPRARASAPPAPTRRRRLNPVTMVGGIIIAIALIAIGVLLLLTTSAPPTPPPPGTPSGGGGQAAQPAVTSTPFATDVVAALATWTPSPTNTPQPTHGLPTPTLPPSNLYKLMFVGEGRNAPNKAIYSIGSDGKGESVVLSGNDPISDVAWSSTHKIAYVSLVAGKQQLFVADDNGGNPKAITKFTGDKVQIWTPNWSPDGKQIVFVTDQPGNKELFLIGADGADITRLTDNKGEDRDPVFSADGHTLFYGSDPTNQHSMQLYKMVLPSKQTTQLTNALNDSYSPTVGADGETIVFVSTRDRYPNIYLISISDPNNAKLLSYTASSANNIDPVWTPDGRYIIFASDRGGKVFNLYIMTPDGKNVQAITAAKNDKDSSYDPQFPMGQSQ